MRVRRQRSLRLRSILGAALLAWFAPALLGWFAPAPAAPGEVSTGLARLSGKELLDRCEPALRLLEAGHRLALDDQEYARAQSCIGFVDGFIYGHGWAAWRQGGDMYYCPPAEFAVQAAVPAVVAYLREHPERLDARAHVLVFAALSHAFPCTPLPTR